MLFTELLHFVLPQAAYVRRRDGTAACDLPFTMADVKAAGGPHAFDSSASTKGEEARGVHEALEADGGALLAEVKAAYADDLALWERARRREAVSEAHESLAASLERYREKVPWLRTTAKAPPTCESGQSSRVLVLGVLLGAREQGGGRRGAGAAVAALRRVRGREGGVRRAAGG